jgi:hypothetical protein
MLASPSAFRPVLFLFGFSAFSHSRSNLRINHASGKRWLSTAGVVPSKGAIDGVNAYKYSDAGGMYPPPSFTFVASPYGNLFSLLPIEYARNEPGGISVIVKEEGSR